MARQAAREGEVTFSNKNSVLNGSIGGPDNKKQGYQNKQNYSFPANTGAPANP